MAHRSRRDPGPAGRLGNDPRRGSAIPPGESRARDGHVVLQRDILSPRRALPSGRARRAEARKDDGNEPSLGVSRADARVAATGRLYRHRTRRRDDRPSRPICFGLAMAHGLGASRVGSDPQHDTNVVGLVRRPDQRDRADPSHRAARVRSLSGRAHVVGERLVFAPHDRLLLLDGQAPCRRSCSRRRRPREPFDPFRARRIRRRRTLRTRLRMPLPDRGPRCRADRVALRFSATPAGGSPFARGRRHRRPSGRLAGRSVGVWRMDLPGRPLFLSERRRPNRVSRVRGHSGLRLSLSSSVQHLRAGRRRSDGRFDPDLGAPPQASSDLGNPALRLRPLRFGPQGRAVFLSHPAFGDGRRDARLFSRSSHFPSGPDRVACRADRRPGRRTTLELAMRLDRPNRRGRQPARPAALGRLPARLAIQSHVLCLRRPSPAARFAHPEARRLAFPRIPILSKRPVARRNAGSDRQRARLEDRAPATRAHLFRDAAAVRRRAHPRRRDGRARLLGLPRLAMVDDPGLGRPASSTRPSDSRPHRNHPPGQMADALSPRVRQLAAHRFARTAR